MGQGTRSSKGRQSPGERIATPARASLSFEKFSFDDRGEVRKRKKKPSKKYKEALGHTPVSMEEDIPWKCKRLIIGTGEGALPVMDEVKEEAKRRKIKLVVLPTAEALTELAANPKDTNAILHLTC